MLALHSLELGVGVGLRGSEILRALTEILTYCKRP